MKSKQNNRNIAELYHNIFSLYQDLVVPFTLIDRDMPFPKTKRMENDAEHSFSLGLIALSLAEHLKLELDTGLIARYALVHDLVEVYSGDVSVRDHDNYSQKHMREEKALIELRDKYSSSEPWMINLIEKYENKIDKESRFVYAVDKVMGAIVRTAGNGINWTDYYPERDGTSYRKVVSVLRKKAESFPELLPLFDIAHDYLDEERLKYHDRDTTEI